MNIMKHVKITGIVLSYILCSCCARAQAPVFAADRTAPCQAAQPAYGDAFIDSSIGDASTIIPILASDSASHGVAALIYNGMVEYDKDLKLVGDLAESWDILDNGLTIDISSEKEFYGMKDTRLLRRMYFLPIKPCATLKHLLPTLTRFSR